MMRIVALVLIVLPARLAAAEEAQIPKEALQALESLVGDWTVEGINGDEKWVGEYCDRWSPGRHCVVSHATWKGPKDKFGLSCIVSWDVATKEIVDSGFDSRGGSFVLRYKVQSPALWTGVSRNVDETGKVILAKISLERKSPDETLWRQTDRVAGDQKLPDWELRFTKRPARQPAAGSAREQMKFLEPLVGNWRTRYLLDGKQAEGEFHAKWGEGKSRIVWSGRERAAGQANGDIQFNGIIAWDPAERRVREFVAASNGAIATAYFEELDGKLLLTRSGTMPDGTQYTMQAKGSRSGDRWTYGPSVATTADGKVVQKIEQCVFELMDGEKKAGKPIASADIVDAATAAPPAEIQEHFDFLAGQWKSEGKVDKDKFTSTASFERVPGKHALVGHWQGGFGGTKVHGTTLLGWDAKAKQVVDFGFIRELGWRAMRYVPRSAGSWEGEMQGVIRGEDLRAKFKVDVTGKDSFVLTSAAGPNNPEQVYRYTRVVAKGKGQAADTIGPPDEALKQMEFYVGKWAGEYKKGGKDIALDLRFQWGLDRQFIIGEFVSKDKASGAVVGELHIVGGQCPISKKFEEWGFDNEGGRSHTVWTCGPDGRRTGQLSGVIGGQPVKLVNERTIVDRDTIRGVITDSARGNAKWPDMPYTMRRQESPQASRPGEPEGQKAFDSWAEFIIGGHWVAFYDGAEEEDTYEWLPGKKFLRMTWRRGAAEPEGVLIAGIDPKTGKMTCWEFHKDGTVGLGMQTLVREGVWSIAFDYAGPKGKQHWTASVTKQGPDRIKVESEMVTGGKSEGKQNSDWTRRRTAMPVKPQGAGANYEHLKFLELLVGAWKVEGTEGAEKLPPSEERSEWVLNKNFLRSVGWTTVAARPGPYEFLTGWDAKEKKIIQWAFGGNDAGFGIVRRIGQHDPAARVWTSRESWLRWQCEEQTGRLAIRFVDNGLAFHFTEQRMGNKDMPERRAIFTRGSFAAPAFSDKPGPGYDRLKPVEWLIGNWKVHGQWADETPHEGEERLEWIMNRNFMRGTGWYRDRDGRRIDYINTIAWDPKANRLLLVGTDSQGYIGVRTGDYDPATKTIVCRESGPLADGGEMRYELRVRPVGDHAFEWVGTKIQRGKETLPDLKITFSRK